MSLRRLGVERIDLFQLHRIDAKVPAEEQFGTLAEPGGVVAELAAARDATPGQLAVAWLLQRSPVMLPIPGTGSLEHLRENVGAATVVLGDADMAALDAAAGRYP